MRLFQSFLVVAAFVLVSGCASYRLGPTNGQAAGDKTIQVVPFTNRTMEPRLGDAVTAALRKQLQRDGTYRLATRDSGDVVVTGVVTRYYRQELSFVPNDVATVRDYRIRMTAQVTARERSTGKVLLDKPVIGHTLIRVGANLTGADTLGADLTSTERQALPLLAEDLAKQVTALLVDGDW